MKKLILYLLILCMMVLGVFGSFIITHLYIEHQQLSTKYSLLVSNYNNLTDIYNDISQDKCLLYNTAVLFDIDAPKVNGVYWIGNDFYCIWANERELDDIEKTDRHEYCHYLVDQDPEHFCGYYS
jgi:hypothetical protein